MEPLQIVNYKKNQYYYEHYDWGSSGTMNENQRWHTVLIYLNDVPKEFGGGTSFPKLQLSIQPIKNAALYFRNLDKDGKGHPDTLHAGNPLETSEIQKYAINSWILQKDDKNWDIPS